MGTKGGLLLALRWSLVSAGVIALFWAVWYVAVGTVPAMTELRLTPGWPWRLPFAVSRWWDVLLGPLAACGAVTVMTRRRFDEDENFRAAFAVGIASGLIYGVVVCSIGGPICGPAYGPIFGLAYGLICGLACVLAYGLASGLAWGLLYGLASGLASGLAYGLICGLAYGLAYGLLCCLICGLASCLICGLASCLICGLAWGCRTAARLPWHRFGSWLIAGRERTAVPYEVRREAEFAGYRAPAAAVAVMTRLELTPVAGWPRHRVLRVAARMTLLALLAAAVAAVL